MQFNCGRVLEACIVVLGGRVYNSEYPAAVASSATAWLISEARKHVSAQSDRLGFSARYQMTSPVSTWRDNLRNYRPKKLRYVHPVVPKYTGKR